MATQHQVIDIRLPSGLILRDAVGLLCVKFGQWPWGRFDGISPADPNTIMDADVDISFSGARARSNVPQATGWRSTSSAGDPQVVSASDAASAGSAG